MKIKMRRNGREGWVVIIDHPALTRPVECPTKTLGDAFELIRSLGPARFFKPMELVETAAEQRELEIPEPARVNVFGVYDA